MRRQMTGTAAAAIALFVVVACTGSTGDPTTPPPTTAASPTTTPIDAREPVLVGEPIDTSTLTGRILLSSDDDLYAANADGTGVVRLTDRRGPEFDAAWSPDGRLIVYRDSRRGFNHDDEIFVTGEGTVPKNLTLHRSNDWGPDWSPDGRSIVFNSDRGDGFMSGFVVRPNGSGLHRIPTDVYVEYPSWAPDSRRIAFMGGESGASEYDIWIVGVDGTGLVQLTDSFGTDGWPAWSPDGRRIAFTSVRDDCSYSDAPDCRTTGDEGPHHDVWIVNVDGTGLRRVTSEFGQFVEWSPDGRYLLVAGYDLYVIRPDGTGRASLDVDGLAGGLFPDWVEGA